MILIPNARILKHQITFSIIIMEKIFKKIINNSIMMLHEKIIINSKINKIMVKKIRICNRIIKNSSHNRIGMRILIKIRIGQILTTTRKIIIKICITIIRTNNPKILLFKIITLQIRLIMELKHKSLILIMNKIS